MIGMSLEDCAEACYTHQNAYHRFVMTGKRYCFCDPSSSSEIYRNYPNQDDSN